MFSTLIYQMGTIFILILVGMAVKKKQIISEKGKKELADLIIAVILPCNIIKAYMVDMGSDFWITFSEILVVTTLNQVLALILTRTVYQRVNSSEKPIYQYATVCSNAGFIGNALAESIYGTTGLLYASVFLIPARIVMWTAGISFFHKGADKKEAYRKVLLHPCMVGTYLGIIIMVFHISLPAVAEQTITQISRCCTPLTMMYIGMVLVGVEWKTLVNSAQVRFALIRLAGIPLIVYTGCRLAGLDGTVTGVCVLLAGMPAGSTTTVLAGA